MLPPIATGRIIGLIYRSIDARSYARSTVFIKEEINDDPNRSNTRKSYDYGCHHRPAPAVGDDLSIYNVPGEHFGDGFTAAIIAPSADWARPVSANVIGLDVRLSAQTETGHYLYLTYTGRVVINDDVAPKMASGEEIHGSEMYFTTNPVIKTNDPALAWMNDTIFVGKMQRNTMAGANGQGHLVYDIYKVV